MVWPLATKEGRSLILNVKNVRREKKRKIFSSDTEVASLLKMQIVRSQNPLRVQPEEGDSAGKSWRRKETQLAKAGAHQAKRDNSRKNKS